MKIHPSRWSYSFRRIEPDVRAEPVPQRLEGERIGFMETDDEGVNTFGVRRFCHRGIVSWTPYRERRGEKLQAKRFIRKTGAAHGGENARKGVIIDKGVQKR